MAEKFKVKVELHVHLDGSVRPKTILDIARRRGINVGAQTVEEMRELVVCSKPPWSLENLLKKFSVFMPVIAGDRDAVYRMAYEFCEDCASHNTKYCEARYSPHLLANTMDPLPYAREKGNYSPSDVVETVNEAFNDGSRDFDINVKSILCCIVHNPEWSDEVAELCQKYKYDGVVGIDIACGEMTGKETDECPHKQAFQAVDDMYAERIGHGYHVMDDEDLYQRLRKSRIHFEVCPLSSVRTGSVSEDLNKHPLHRFIDDGVNFSINSDDPVVLDNDLSVDYNMAIKMGMSEDAIIKCIFNAARSCFAPDKEKKELIDLLIQEYGEH